MSLYGNWLAGQRKTHYSQGTTDQLFRNLIFWDVYVHMFTLDKLKYVTCFLIF